MYFQILNLFSLFFDILRSQKFWDFKPWDLNVPGQVMQVWCVIYIFQMLDRTNHTPDLHDLLGNVKVSGFENRMFLRPKISLVFFGLRPKVNIRSQVLKKRSQVSDQNLNFIVFWSQVSDFILKFYKLWSQVSDLSKKYFSSLRPETNNFKTNFI